MRRVLFDQNVPRALAPLLSGCVVETAAGRGWGALQNGDLLRAADQAGFEVMVTADQNIIYQQNLRERRIALVVLSTNHWPTLRSSGAAVLRAVLRSAAQDVTVVDCKIPAERRVLSGGEP